MNQESMKVFLRQYRFAGTNEYTAPELFELGALKSSLGVDKLFGKNIDISKFDVFSLGVSLFLIVVKSLPFGKADLLDSYYRKFVENKDQYWKIFSKLRYVSKDFKNLVNGMFELSNDSRLDFSGLMTHKWTCIHSQDYSFHKAKLT